MSDLALQAYLCNYLEENKDIRFFCTLKKRLHRIGRFDLLDILNNYPDFSLKVKIFLFNRRLGGGFCE